MAGDVIPEQVSSPIVQLATENCEFIDQQLAGLNPCQIVLVTIVVGYVFYHTICIAFSLFKFLTDVGKVKTKLFRLAMYIPQVKAQVEKEQSKVMSECTSKFRTLRKGAMNKLPTEGTSESKIISIVKAHAQESKKHYTGKGNVSGSVYINDEKHWEFLGDVTKQCLLTNPLHVDEFMWLSTMEAEIIRWTLDLYNGDKNTCGIMTSGGTESILLAMLSYKMQGKKEKGITQPNIVCSETAHCAFDKAGFYFGIEIRKVPMGKGTFKADFEGIKKQVDSNTVCIVASCPDYPFGNYDPVEKIAELAQSWGIGCHSDCCLGSYVNPFIEELGYPLAQIFDFRVPGVTTISCDPHKYGYGPKGASVLMFRNKKLRQYQLYVNTDWNGGIYGTTCMAGSRPGSAIAGTWSSLLKFGRDGLKEKARGILEAQKQIKLAFKDDPDIIVTSTDASQTFSFTSKTCNAIAMSAEMQKRHWQIAKLQRPASAHIGITDSNQANWKEFVKCIRECVKDMKADPSLNKNHDTAIYGISGSIPDKSLLRDFVIVHQDAMLDTLE